MKRIIVFVLAALTMSFTMPPVVDDVKNNWVYELKKPIIKAAAETDYLAIYEPSLDCANGTLIYYIDTNSVPYGRLWDLEFHVNGTHAPYVTIVVWVPAYTTEATGYTYVNWACTNTIVGTWAGLH